MNINKELKLKADKLFYIFEDNLFQNNGNYPRRTNLILEFSEYIINASKEELEKYITFNSDEEFLMLKKCINSGIDKWLDNGEIKTMLLY